MKGYKVIIVLSLFFFCQCKSPQKVVVSHESPMEVYLLIGQSNMAGRAPIEEQDRDSIKNVFLFTGDESKPWEKAANPLNKYSTVRKEIGSQKLGLGYSFAKTMAVARTAKIGLVVNAKGGTAIEEWERGANLYTEAVNQTKKALKYGVLKGIIWHQGESNAAKYDEYMPKIEALIASLRKDLDSPNLPFVAGQLSVDKPARAHFNKMILELPKKVNNTAVVTTENTITFDGTHFDSASHRILGQRYAEEMIRLISGK